MYHTQAAFRTLHHQVLSHKGWGLFGLVLMPWIETNPNEIGFLQSFATRSGDPIPQADPEELCRLYALSRVNELLLLRFQRGRADGTDWPGPQISLDEYLMFAERLGIRVEEGRQFSPFYHEIVEVEEASNADQPITLADSIWPCLMLGDMLFSRAGVRVTGGASFIRKDIAESSTLYWAYRRKNRPFCDLSQGWGSNSQWRTSFRRDYRIGPVFYFNVDGKHDLAKQVPTANDRDGLTGTERIELLTNRCFVVAAKPHDDLWPWDDSYTSSGGAVLANPL
jgi:hypothetical protein